MKTVTPVQVDWPRIEVSLRHRFKREPEIRKNIPSTIETLKRLSLRSEDRLRGRRALRNIGISLTSVKKELTIISPICLSIPSGPLQKPEVSGLVKSHIAFLEGLSDILPPWKLVCLFPPPERDDPPAEAYIRSVCELTRQHHIDDPRIEVTLMTSFAPGMIALEELVIEEICASSYLSNLCAGFIRQRSAYYTSLNIPSELWPRRNRRTMSQYVILGRLAALHGWLMCNHTSVNILCAQYAGGGVLHNPVGFRQ